MQYGHECPSTIKTSFSKEKGINEQTSHLNGHLLLSCRVFSTV